MTTKQKIIQAAIELFNQQGVIKAKIQDIAKAAGISPGNLTYHYTTKKELIQSVYRYMMKTLEEVAYGNRIFVQGIEGMDVARDYLAHQLKFRFFYLDTLEILRECPEIKEAHQMQVESEIGIIKNLIYFALGKGYLIQEPIEGHYEALAQNTWMVLYFWLTQQAVRGKTEFAVEAGIQAQATLFWPYLTEKGITYYQTKFERLKSESLNTEEALA